VYRGNLPERPDGLSFLSLRGGGKVVSERGISERGRGGEEVGEEGNGHFFASTVG